MKPMGRKCAICESSHITLNCRLSAMNAIFGNTWWPDQSRRLTLDVVQDEPSDPWFHAGEFAAAFDLVLYEEDMRDMFYDLS